MTDCCELLIAEHRRTETLLGDLETRLRQLGGLHLGDTPNDSDWAEVQALYETLTRDLHRHYALEEKALFPVLSQYRTMMLMEVEHEDLLVLQQAFADHLAQLSVGQAERSADALDLLFQRFEAFRTRLLAHIVEEERGIFPLANERLEPEEKLKVLRLTNELVDAKNPSAYDLIRPEPGFILKKVNLSAPATRPMDYQTLFEREHNSIQTLRLQAGQQQAFHWAGQTQVLVVLQGELRFEAQCADGKKTQMLGVGDTLTIDSRLLFSLSSVTEALLMLYKVWPHPHYTKS
jgi:hemerythrin-like domain-containing protein